MQNPVVVTQRGFSMETIHFMFKKEPWLDAANPFYFLRRNPMNRAAAEWLPASRRFRALCCTAAFRRAFSSAHCALSVSNNSLSRAASSRLSSRSFVSRSIFACQVFLSPLSFFRAFLDASSSAAAASVGVRQGRCAAFSQRN